MRLALELANDIMAAHRGNLDLCGTGVTELPDGLSVGGNLDLRGTRIAALPNGLAVGGWLDLRGTAIDGLPEDLAVGGRVYPYDTGTGTVPCRVTWLRNGDYAEGGYIYADGILTHVKKKKTLKGYTFFVGKIPGRNVVYDGKYYAHCRTLREGIADLLFKAAKDRGADQYRNLPLDGKHTVDELVTMYRVITGACRQGSQAFVDSLGKKLKKHYGIRETIVLTKGQYGAEKFAAFFGAT